VKSDRREFVASAVRTAGERYFDECRGRVDGFVAAHFRYPGAWDTNRRALGWDLARAPVNLFWAPIYVFVMLLRWQARRRGWWRLAGQLDRVPTGFRTRVQRHVADLISRELFHRGQGDDLAGRVADALEALMEDRSAATSASSELAVIIEGSLGRYGLTRTAAADITNSLASTALGAFAFKQFTPGGIAVGLLLASWVARERAADSFVLGSFLGEIFYSLFPVDPSPGLQVAGVATVLACLAAFASFSGLLTDPLQSVLGVHHRRLHRMIDSVQRDFERATDSSFHPRSPYVARLLELIDVARPGG
jgi:hypothetical protein